MTEDLPSLLQPLAAHLRQAIIEICFADVLGLVEDPASGQGV